MYNAKAYCRDLINRVSIRILDLMVIANYHKNGINSTDKFQIRGGQVDK
jgi:hypothetical protein